VLGFDCKDAHAMLVFHTAFVASMSTGTILAMLCPRCSNLVINFISMA
jgi:hypothetical protein